MSLFQCEECGCCDNTATSGYWFRNDKGNPCEGRKLCAACDPSIGKWHGVFKQRFLPKGEFHTNQQGNLEHTESGSIDICAFEMTHEPLHPHNDGLDEYRQPVYVGELDPAQRLALARGELK